MSEVRENLTALESALESEGVFAYVTSGVSMEPLFRTHRDVVVIARADAPLRPNDIALYRSKTQGKYILHRIIRVRSDCYVIRGDNTYAPEYVPKDMVIGVLTEFNRRGKRYTTSHLGYRIYSRFWRLIYPLRWICHALWRLAARVYRFLFKRNKKR